MRTSLKTTDGKEWILVTKGVQEERNEWERGVAVQCHSWKSHKLQEEVWETDGGERQQLVP